MKLQLKERAADKSEYPFNLPLIRGLDIEFTAPVTFFVGENGTGKSTVIEAIAALCKLPVSGGGRNELTGSHGPDTSSGSRHSFGHHFDAGRATRISSGAQILSFDGAALRQTSLEDTSHFQITKGIMQNPAAYWKHLRTFP